MSDRFNTLMSYEGHVGGFSSRDSVTPVTNVVREEPDKVEGWMDKIKGAKMGEKKQKSPRSPRASHAALATWRARYFRFTDAALRWYKDEMAIQFLGEVGYSSIDKLLIIDVEESRCLQVTTAHKVYILRTSESKIKSIKLPVMGLTLQRHISWATGKPIGASLTGVEASQQMYVLKQHPGVVHGWASKANKGGVASKKWKRRYLRIGKTSIGWYKDDKDRQCLGEMPFNSITNVMMTLDALEVTTVIKTFCFKGETPGIDTCGWRVVFLRCWSFGAGIPLVGDLEDALPSYMKQAIQAKTRKNRTK